MTVDASPEPDHLLAALDAALDAAIVIASAPPLAHDPPQVREPLERCAGHLLIAAITTSDRDLERSILAVRDEVGACLLAADAADAADTHEAAHRLRARAIEAVLVLTEARRHAS